MSEIQQDRIECNVCLRLNPKDAIFCERCIAPINVRKLGSFTQEDLALAVEGLLESLAHIAILNSALNASERDLLESYLTAFWLRPESALYQAAEARIVSPLIEQTDGKLLDLGCGNGVNTSLLAGWRFGPDFDVFTDLKLEDDDIYNSLPREPITLDVRKQGRIIDFGIDIKESMVQRAGQLGSFARTLCVDATSIPIDAGEIGGIYSNVLRDFDSEILRDALGECARLLRPNGDLFFSSPTEGYKSTLYYYPRAAMMDNEGRKAEAKEYLELDRGRSTYCAQQISIDEWKNILEPHGFEIVEIVPFADKRLMEVWDTGLRPFTPLFIRLCMALSDSRRRRIKSAFVDFSMRLLGQLLVTDREPVLPGFRLIHARKKL